MAARTAGAWNEKLDAYGAGRSAEVQAPESVSITVDGVTTTRNLSSEAFGWATATETLGFADSRPPLPRPHGRSPAALDQRARRRRHPAAARPHPHGRGAADPRTRRPPMGKPRDERGPATSLKDQVAPSALARHRRRLRPRRLGTGRITTPAAATRYRPRRHCIAGRRRSACMTTHARPTVHPHRPRTRHCKERSMANSKDAVHTSSPRSFLKHLHRPQPAHQHGGRHDRPLRGMVRLVHLRTAGSGVRGADLPQPLTLRIPDRSAADLRDRVRRPPIQRNHHLPTGRPLRPTGRPGAVRLRDGAGLPDHRPHPVIRHDRLRGADAVRHRPHHPGHLGRQRAAERHLVHGRTRSPEPERPVRFLHQHGQRPRDPRRDRFRRDRDSILRSGRPRRRGAGASRSSSAASSASSVSSCGPAPTKPPNSRQGRSSIRSPRRRDCWTCSANTRRHCCRQRRCPPRPWPTTPGPPSCPPTPA